MEQLLICQIDQIGRDTAQPAAAPVNVGGVAVDLAGLQRRNLFMYEGKCWCVPKTFSFPIEVTCLNGWRMWLMGKAVIHEGTALKEDPFIT